MKEYKIYPYRWVVLLCTLPILAMTNIFWLTFAPITNSAESYYNVSGISIAFLSMCYMIVYIIAAIPASILIDTKGFKISVTIGAVLSAVFGMARGIFADNYTIVVICQIGVALGQPFLVNAITKIAARWFPIDSRATASGLATMAGYVGMVIAMILSPRLFESVGMKNLLMYYGYASVICALIFIMFAREKPKTPPGPEYQSTTFKVKEINKLFKKKTYIYLMICMFVMMGIFNAVMTWIEEMLSPRGITSVQAGLIGGILVIVGLIGAVILPAFSDKLKRRRPLLLWPIILTIPAFLGLTFSSEYIVIAIFAGLVGFLVMGMGPIAFQYGAEVAYPVPEGTSFGILMLMGQISGIIFIFLMDALGSAASGDMTLSLVIFSVLILITFIIALKLKESPIILDATGNISNKECNKPEGELLEKRKKELCEAGLRLLETGLIAGTWGNISMKLNDDYMLITPSGIPYDKLTPDDMVLVNINDFSYDSNNKPSSEKRLHGEIYKTRKEFNAIIHTHSSNASTVAAAKREVPPLLDDMVQILGPSVRVADYALPGSKKLVKGAIKALKGRSAVLLANHGAACGGRNLEEAFTACFILEKACKTFIEVQFLGGGVPINKFESYMMHKVFLKKYSKNALEK
ncbi:hypothetical protein SH1V18_24720 [Vallitalea longa]|uniref:Major facilitator superfamily (MFS) profile domain-containing protein n=1 Tax=Vallitalea longa TaxID=2936439 RepID=A0A9W5Y9V9_9FIRM|nr:MFS transporter [Vallitalea longa]GKX29992.1 hypothetical protein SH1V18_24720 [Vallitalea longa]